MIGSSIIWRMALGNLRKQWKQTLLTIVAGTIGVLLISISIVNYDSVKHSGDAWIERELGPINWKLKPALNSDPVFSPQQVAELTEQAASLSYELLPYVSVEAAGVARNATSGEENVLGRMLLMGFPFADAVQFDPAGAELWQDGLTDEELIMNQETAGLLKVKPGDTITVRTADGERLLRIRQIVPQRGLSGFTDSGAYTATMIGTEKLVRELSNQPGDGYKTLLMGAAGRSVNPHAVFYSPTIQVEMLKADYIAKVKSMDTSPIIAMISAVAIISSLLFMRQVLVMIGESRRELYSILRAIGLYRRQIAAIFLVEGLLLSLLSALAGAGGGAAAGYVAIKLMYRSHSEELSRMVGSKIPIEPFVSVANMLAVCVGALLFLSLVTVLAARKAAVFPIIQGLRGDIPEGNKRKRGFVYWVVCAIGLFLLMIHIHMAFIKVPEINGDTIVMVVGSWLAASCMLLYLALAWLGRSAGLLQKLLGMFGISRLSVMLASKYPSLHKGRTYTAALLFAMVMMMITFVVCLAQALLASNDVDRKEQRIIGFGSYAAYQSSDEKEQILTVAANDSILAEHIREAEAVEPYMLLLQQNSLSQSIIPVSSSLLEEGKLELFGRAPQFATDREAWQAVASDARYIILPHYYMQQDSYSDSQQTIVKAGDNIRLPIYESKLRAADEEWEPVAQREFIVAGFVANSAYELLIDFYGATFVHETVAEELRPNGFKWENQQGKGFVLFDIDFRDIALVQQLEARFIMNGVLNFSVPYVINGAEQLKMSQLASGLIGFAVFSALIGLMGLSIIQIRAVRERSRQIAMMQCIGISDKQLSAVFMLEGFFVSVTGLLVGWLIGSSGAHIFVVTAKASTRIYEAPLIVHYPYSIILPILVGLLLTALWINKAPARAALRLKPADALRMSHE